MKIKEPETEEELEEYYDLRWRVLRKPWNKPKGSEKDEIENKSHHIIAKTGEEKIIGVGRGHFNTPKEAQIRFMAVRKEYREEGVGSSILEKLEKILKEKGAEYIVLNARESALRFYRKHGYRVTEEIHKLFGEIQHHRMKKNII